MNEHYTLVVAQRMRQIIGQACEQHQLDCGACVSPDVFMCDTLRQLLALKFRWLRIIRQLKAHDGYNRLMTCLNHPDNVKCEVCGDD